VVQDEGSGIILQSTIQGHIFQVDPQVICRIIGVPVLPNSGNPFNEVLEPSTLDLLRDFFHAHPQGEVQEHAHIKIGDFSPPHRLLAKIVQHNLLPIVHRSELVLKMDQFLYAIVMRLPFLLVQAHPQHHARVQR
jgi:hypothetical protein